MNDLLNQAQAKRMSYIPFQFPLGATEDKVVFTYAQDETSFSTELLLSKDGMTLLLQNLYGYVDRAKAKSLYRKDLKEFANYINQCRLIQENADLWRKNQTYTLAINNGMVHGIVVNYNPKSNETVLQDILDSGLSINRASITTKEMNVYIAHRIKEGFEIGLHVRNGESGYTSLSYRMYIYKGDYTFSTPTFGRRKHLSKLEIVDENLQDLYAEIHDIAFHEFVMTNSAKEFAELILEDEKLEKLWNLVEPFDSKLKKVYSLLGSLHAQASIRGWKTICNKALDKIYASIMEKL